MDIIIGKSAGFCYGVQRAVEGARDEIEKAEKNIYCLGEIVHNKQVVNNLKERGLIFIDDINQVEGKTIIRAHGVKKEVYEEAKKRKIELKDFTCPNVLKIHEIVEEYSENGYYIFLCGSKNHPENIGTISYSKKNIAVIENEVDVSEALKQLQKSKIKKLLIISQTTYSIQKFNIIENLVKEQLSSDVKLIIKNTICKATELRQKETEEISRKVEYMIIVGGINSSNTKKLYEIAKINCKNCICVETVQELNMEEIINKKTIGIMAGASTPKESIQEIVNEINNSSKLMVGIN